GRTIATSAVVATAAGVVLLMLGLATFLDRLQSDPATIGKRYELTTDLPAASVPDVAALPGVADASSRYSVDAVSSFSLGQPFRVVAFPGDHTDFEAPPLTEGRRLAGPREAEVGVGLATALGLEQGTVLAVQLPSGEEARFRVAGIVQTLENDGLLAFVGRPSLLASQPDVEAQIAVRVADGADVPIVAGAIGELGGSFPEAVGGATTDDRAFLGVLADVLRVVAVVNLLICLYALVQALAVTVVERRSVIAVLRAAGARRQTVALMLLGTALAVVAVATPLAVLLEHFLLGPIVARLAAGYADLPLNAAPLQIAAVIAGLVVLAAAAAGWVARRAEREPIVAGLRER
ncbi:MAG: FtsX-like permease family protein, partial [Solirubrobacterales bacterium]|nr:FtsX-like permease family protein [Solirubrobacterales bacterium]